MRKKKVNPHQQENTPQEKIADWLKLPKDILMGASIVTIMGNQELLVENYKGILEYKDDIILLQGKKQRIRITGKRLQIINYTKEEVKINGMIAGVSYE